MPLADHDVHPLRGEAEARECAELMASMEPWRTLGRTVEAGVRGLTDPGKEVYVVRDGSEIAGFLVLDLHGMLKGYIQTVCVAPSRQRAGLGSFLVEWAERRIARESPNVFLCVSSFNPDAQRLYRRLGYEVVGSLTDFIVTGHHEILLRKSTGSWSAFRRTTQAS
jgi:ribosomal protein S18 acetylase RimI-like enzyme